MAITQEEYDEGIIKYTLENKKGMKVELINVGAGIIGVYVPDRHGDFSNVVLRNDTLEEYYGNLHFLGSVIAPVAGRVKDSQVKVNGETFSFEGNDGDHLLHSGDLGLHNILWDSRIIEEAGMEKVSFSAGVEKGYPGEPEVSVTYSLNDENELKLDYEVISRGSSAIAPTNHVYFNLNNDLEKTVANHHVNSNVSRYLKMDEDLIPVSAEPCEGVFDLSDGRELEEVFSSADGQIGIANGGYDHYFMFKGEEDHFVVYEPESGRKVSMQTDFPGLVFYTGNNLDDGLPLKDRMPQKYMGFCMEAQVSPAVQHLDLGFDMEMDGFCRNETVFRFDVEE